MTAPPSGQCSVLNVESRDYPPTPSGYHPRLGMAEMGHSHTGTTHCAHPCTAPRPLEDRGAGRHFSHICVGSVPPSFCSRGTRVCKQPGVCPRLTPGSQSQDRLSSSLLQGASHLGVSVVGGPGPRAGLGQHRLFMVSQSRAELRGSQQVRRSWPASPHHGCLVARTGAHSSQAPLPKPRSPTPTEQTVRPTWLIQASWGVCGARQMSAPSPVLPWPGAGPSPRSVWRGTPGAAPGPRTPLPSGPCVVRGPACSPGSADTATGLLCLRTGPAPTGARGWGGTPVGRKGSPGDVEGGDNGERGRTE